MADIEKVIKGWECHMEADTLGCADCPYRQGWRTCNFADTLFKDVYALLKDYDTQLQYRDDHIAMYQAEIKRLEALLKEQEAKPVEVCGQMFTVKYGHCPTCGKGMDSDTYPHWCGFCGQAVKWE